MEKKKTRGTGEPEKEEAKQKKNKTVLWGCK